MEGELPMLSCCLLQHTLKSLCCYSDSSNPSKWVYAVFWRILPRNYPPPKWDYGGTALDRAKGNKRNWILVWEDGFCDFIECENAGSGFVKGRFGPHVFFKMTHEVYSYGEGLVGKVAADNSHKWAFRTTSNENDPGLISSWNISIEPQPKAWESHFNSGIQTIAVISVREGIVQLGSFDKVAEDLNLVIHIQKKFSYLQSIPGVLPVQRSSYLPAQLPIKFPTLLKPIPPPKIIDETFDDPHIKSINLGWNSPQNSMASPPIWSIPPLLPGTSCNFGAFLSKLPSTHPPSGNSEACLLDGNHHNGTGQVKANDGGGQRHS